MTRDGKDEDLDPMHCGNCYSLLENKPKVSKLFTHDKDIQVLDAIAYVYGISSEEFKNRSSEYFENNSVNYQTEDHASLCQSCAPILSEIYKNYKQFQSATHPLSLVDHIRKSSSRKPKSRDDEQQISKNIANSYPLCSNSAEMQNQEDDLFDDFNFDEGDAGSLSDSAQETEEKHFAELDQEINSAETESEQKSECRRSTRTRQAVLKLERLSPEELLEHYAIKIENTSTKGRKKSIRNQSPKDQDQESDLESSSAQKKVDQTKDGLYNCNLCGKGFRHRNLKYSHQKKCLALQKTKKNLRGKKRKGPRFGTYNCSECGRGFTERHMLRRHETSHLPKELRGAVCQICGKLVCGRKYLRKHMKRMHGSEEEKQKLNLKTPCEICGKLLTKENVKRHMVMQHSDAPRETFKCDKCEKVYLSKVVLEEHMLTHSEDFTPYLCNVCGKTFATKISLYNHEKIHGEKKFECAICSKKFLNIQILKNHEYTHSTERNFACEVCGQTFKSKKHMAPHLKMHKEIAERGEYSFKCEDCGNFFKNRRTVEDHKRRVHRQDLKKKIYECSFCGKRLYTSTNLKFHENLHKNDPGYQPRKEETRPRKPRFNPEKINASSSIPIDPMEFYNLQ